MADSAIEWTDAVWNPVTGCDRVSPGCANCYALTLAKRLKGMGQPRYQRDGDPKTSGPGFGLTLHPDKLGEPLRWRKPRRVFVNSMSDLFHEEIPDAYIREVFDVMNEADRHTFQVLTKRPERMRDLYHQGGYALTANIWLGTSIENSRYTWRADALREVPAAVRFISAEPLLGSLFEGHPPGEREWAEEKVGHGKFRKWLNLDGIDWLIVGGESGPGARPLDLTWARELRDACLGTRAEERFSIRLGHQAPQGVGTAFFFKQVGGITPKAGGRLLDGREWNEYPLAATPQVA